MTMRRKRFGVTLLLAALAAVPGLIIAGLVVLFANPCFYRQFPVAGCPVASVLPGSAGWVLIWSGIALLGLIGASAFVASAVTTSPRS
jgi:hypothetical protein